MGVINYDLKKIKAVLFDVDGVLSKETITLSADGTPLRSVNIKDGYAIVQAIRAGLTIGIITGGSTVAVKTRFERLGIKYIYQGASVKKKELMDFMNKTGLDFSEIAYMGDDIPDYEVLSMVGLPLCPADAANEVKGIVKYVSAKNGGCGCGRDVIEQILKVQGKWMSGTDSFGW